MQNPTRRLCCVVTVITMHCRKLQRRQAGSPLKSKASALNHCTFNFPLEKMHRYLLQPPGPRGSPFVITNKTITELHLALAKRAGTYKVGWLVPCGVGA